MSAVEWTVDETGEPTGLTRRAELALKYGDDLPIINGRLYPDDPRAEAAESRARWATTTVLNLLPEPSDTSFDALYTLCKFGHRIGQMCKAIGQVALVAAGHLCGLELGSRHASLVGSGHDASPSLGLDNRSVGDGRPGPAGEAGPGHTESGAS